jgi:hypothetical protein
LCNGSFDGMQLLGNLEARQLRFDHVDDAAEVTFGAPQAPDDFRMALWIGFAFKERRPAASIKSGNCHGTLPRVDTIPIHILA